MTAPPVLSGAVQERVAEASPNSAVSEVGAPVTEIGVALTVA